MSTTPTTPISPKVIAGTVTGIAITAVLAAITAITPDAFSFLGPWSGIAYLVVSTLGAAIAGYVKRDPLRQAITNKIAAAIPPAVVAAVNVAAPIIADAKKQTPTK